MLDSGILPPVHELFSLGFLGENASRLLDDPWGVARRRALDRWGTSIVRAWCIGGRLDRVARRDSDVGPPSRRLRSKPRFARSRCRPRPPRDGESRVVRRDRACGGGACPRRPDALDPPRRRGYACWDERRGLRARGRLPTRALERDGSTAGSTRSSIEPGCDPVPRSAAAGRAALTALADDEHMPRTWRDRAQEALADDDLVHARDARASDTYRSLAAHAIDEDVARTLESEVPRPRPSPARRAIDRPLVGEPGSPSGPRGCELPVPRHVGRRDPRAPGRLSRGQEPGTARRVGPSRQLRLDRAGIEGRWEGADGPASVRSSSPAQRGVCACALGDAVALARVRRMVGDADSPFAGTSGRAGSRLTAALIIARAAG